MEIVTPQESDWQVFQRLAAEEDWLIPDSELALFSGPLNGAAFVLKDEEDCRGFVTAVCHGRSAWIGNLLVPPGYRGRGHGSELFAHALEVLTLQGAEDIWLTASEQGRPLYEKRGFREIGAIERWQGTAMEEGHDIGDPNGIEALLEVDRRVWGEARPMLKALAGEGRILVHGGSAALLQAGNGTRVIGPWITPDLCPRENRLLLRDLLSSAPGGTRLVCDVFDRSPVRSLLRAADFTVSGRTALMVRGAAREVDLAPLVSLASLGSIG